MTSNCSHSTFSTLQLTLPTLTYVPYRDRQEIIGVGAREVASELTAIPQLTVDTDPAATR